VVGALAGVVAALLVVIFAVYLSRQLERRSSTGESDLEANINTETMRRITSAQMHSQQSSTFSTTSATGLLPGRIQDKKRCKNKNKSKNKAIQPYKHSSKAIDMTPSFNPNTDIEMKNNKGLKRSGKSSETKSKDSMEALRRALYKDPGTGNSYSSEEDMEDTTTDREAKQSHDDLVLSSGSLDVRN